MTGAGPPKCRTYGCGKAEWGHLCSGAPVRTVGLEVSSLADLIGNSVPVKQVARQKALSTPVAEAVPEPPAAVVGGKRGRPKTIADKKEYFKVKARERRAKKKVKP